MAIKRGEGEAESDRAPGDDEAGDREEGDHARAEHPTRAQELDSDDRDERAEVDRQGDDEVADRPAAICRRPAGPQQQDRDEDKRILEHAVEQDRREDRVEDPSEDPAHREKQVEAGQVGRVRAIRGELSMREHRRDQERPVVDGHREGGREHGRVEEGEDHRHGEGRENPSGGRGRLVRAPGEGEDEGQEVDRQGGWPRGEGPPRCRSGDGSSPRGAGWTG
jgi:hypothetical protein